MEVGAQGTSVLFVDAVSGTQERAGFGTRLTYNFSPVLALDVQSDFFPGNSLPGPQRGGRALLGLAGPRAGWHWKKIGLFVEARPGIVNFSNVIKITTGILPNSVPFFAESTGGHRTHLALNLGGVLELNAGRRTLIRIDAGEMLVRYDDRNYPIPGTQGGSVNIPGVIGNSLLVSAGVSYRLGSVGGSMVATTENARGWEVGVQYGLLSLGRAEVVNSPSLEPFALGDDPGFGGRLTYNFNRWLAMDSAVNYFYRNSHIGDAQRGGKMIQGGFGPKAGFRTRRAGIFVKARPGFLSYGSVHDSFFPPFPTHRLTHFAVDFGAVLEFYPSRRTMLRFDLDHALVFYGSQMVLAPKGLIFPNGSFVNAGFRDNGMEFTTGFGWRF